MRKCFYSLSNILLSNKCFFFIQVIIISVYKSTWSLPSTSSFLIEEDEGLTYKEIEMFTWVWVWVSIEVFLFYLHKVEVCKASVC